MSKYISLFVVFLCATGASFSAFASIEEVAQDPTVTDLAMRVTKEPRFTLIAALMLTLLMYAIKRVPKVKDWLALNPMRTRAATAVLALTPGVVTILVSRTTWDASATAALVAFLTSTGLDKILSKPKGST